MKVIRFVLFFLVGVSLLPDGSLAAPRRAVITNGSFEDEAFPGIVSSGQRLALNGDHYKDGAHSLQWQFRPGEELKFAHGEEAVQSISFWVYLPAPRPGESLTVRLENTGTYSRSVGLNFRGWRRFVLAYNRGKFPQAIDEAVTLTAPDSEGILYLDLLEFNVRGLAALEGDSNIPYNNRFGQFHGSWYWRSSFLKPQSPPSVTPAQRAAFAEMRDRYLESYASFSETKTYLPTPDPEKALHIFEEQNAKVSIRRKEDFITGTPITGLGDIETFGFLLEWHAQKWRRHPNPEDAERALLIWDHFVEQGYCDDSSRGTTDHHLWSLRRLGPALVLLRPLLAESGRLEHAARSLVWLSTLERIFEPLAPGSLHNASYSSTSLMLGALMLMDDDDPDKITYIDRYLDWHAANAIPTILTGIRNPDFTQHFHSRHSAGYYAGDFISIGKAIYTLQCAPFSIPERVLHDFRMKYLINEFTSCETTPSAVQGNRFPFSYKWGLFGRLQGFTHKQDEQPADHFLFTNHGNTHVLGLVEFPGDPRDTQSQVQGSLRRWGRNYAREPQLFRHDAVATFENAEAKPAPSGFLPLNFANLSTFRRDDWMVALAGYDQYVPAGEFSNHGTHARYFFNGSLWIHGQGEPVINQVDSGYEAAGFDYNHVPGTTAIVLDADELPGERFLYSTEAFSGGVHLAGEHGIFTTVLAGNPDSSFHARKSYFCFGDRIVCLGSGIANSNAKPTHTTLFQVNLSRGGTAQRVGEETLDEVPSQKSWQNQNTLTLSDPKANGYYLFPDQKLVVERREFVTQGPVSRAPSPTSVAYLDHGSAPQSAGYRYVVMVRPGEEKLAQFAARMAGKNPPLPLVEAVGEAHVVIDAEHGLEGYVAFAGHNFRRGLLRSIDHAAVVTVERVSGDELRFAVGNPDLDLLPHPNPTETKRFLAGETPITAIIDGLWQAELNESLEDPWQYGSLPEWSVQADPVRGVTRITYDATLGRSLNLRLRRMEEMRP